MAKRMGREIRWAKGKDLPAIQRIDREVVSNPPGRSVQIAEAIERQQCRVILSNSRIVGFMTWSTSSFRESDFINLLVVDANCRRQGFASALLKDFQDISAGGIAWTSTNASNSSMRSLLKKWNWIESDHSEELDPGDPDLFYSWQREEI